MVKWLPAILALLGVFAGGVVAVLSPPRLPADWYTDLAFLAGGLGAIGLFLGYALSLLIRRRVNWLFVSSAFVIPFSFILWFLFAKSGDWYTARVIVIVGITASVFFLASAWRLLHKSRPLNI